MSRRYFPSQCQGSDTTLCTADVMSERQSFLPLGHSISAYASAVPALRLDLARCLEMSQIQKML